MRIKTPTPCSTCIPRTASAGRVQSVDDLISKLNITGLNPQTGPFWVEGAEPGDTVAVHFVSISPARDWAAVDRHGPKLFGARLIPAARRTSRRCVNEPLEEK